ncbi:MAG: phosphatase PAP2 family protein [Oscillospiraceae bacterium]|jgi:undecaprenyl-diphosphatase|nr:phosphatase PAP2 family protein [Oscillospiraceae bacterium]
MDAILHFDWNIFAALESALNIGHNGVLDNFFAFITTLGDSGIFWLGLGIIMLFFKKTRIWGAGVILAVAITGGLNDLLLKPLFERPRPFDFDWPAWTGRPFYYPEIIARPDGFSFPSGHTSSSFAAATALWCIDDKKSRRAFAIPGTILAAIIGFSRLYLHVHYPTDVLGGVLAGMLYGLIAIACIKIAQKLWEAYVAPKLKKNKATM